MTSKNPQELSNSIDRQKLQPKLDCFRKWPWMSKPTLKHLGQFKYIHLTLWRKRFPKLGIVSSENETIDYNEDQHAQISFKRNMWNNSR